MPHFHVPAIPVAQPRQRSANIAGHIRNYTPAKHPVNAFKAAVQVSFQAKCPNWPVTDEPLWLRLLFAFPRPANRRRKKDGVCRLHCGKKPDIDNLAKSVLDALNGLAWSDDSRVCEVSAGKVYCGLHEQPHVEIEFGTFTDEPATAASYKTAREL